MTRNIDELNNLKKRSVDPKTYFGEMDLTKKQKDDRIDFTQKVNEILDLVLVLLLTMSDKYFEEYDYIRDLLETQLLETIGDVSVLDGYLIGYVTDFTQNFIDVTRKNIEDEWFTSPDRALFNAENSANDVFNYVEYMDALMAGKTQKQWITKKDKRVRTTHRIIDGKTIGIDELFNVGGVLMRFPKDTALAGERDEEIINCRCSARYF